MSQSRLIDFKDGDDDVMLALDTVSTEQLANEVTAYFTSRNYRTFLRRRAQVTSLRLMWLNHNTN